MTAIRHLEICGGNYTHTHKHTSLTVLTGISLGTLTLAYFLKWYTVNFATSQMPFPKIKNKNDERCISSQLQIQTNIDELTLIHLVQNIKRVYVKSFGEIYTTVNYCPYVHQIVTTSV